MRTIINGDVDGQRAAPPAHPYTAVRFGPRSGSARELAGAALWLAAGTLLRELREARGWSQHELARRANVSLGIVAQYELGENRRPILDAWWRLTTALGRELAHFVGDAEGRVRGRFLAGSGMLSRAPHPVATTSLTTALSHELWGGAREIEGELRALVDEVRAWAAARAREREARRL